MPDWVWGKYWRAKLNADAGLTGARLHWTFHSERYHLKLLLLINGIVFFIILQAARLPDLAWLGLVIWSMFFVIIVWLGLYVDDKTWRGRTIKIGELPPIPWRPNMHLWERDRGKVQTEEDLGDGREASPSNPLDNTEYGIAFINEVEQWVEGVKPYDPILIAPTLLGAHPVKEIPSGKAPRSPVLQPDTDRVRILPSRAKGIGWWSGLEYRVPGTPHIYFLGQDGLTEHIKDQKVKMLLVGLDREARAKLNSLVSQLGMPKSKWYRPVIYIEEPPPEEEIGKAKPMSSPLDLKLLLENMDLRAQLDEAMTHSEKIMSAYTRTIDRLGKGA